MKASRDWRGALTHYAKSVELAPDYLSARSNLCNLWREMRQWSESVECYTAMAQLKPDTGMTHALIGDSLYHEHSGAEAVRARVRHHLEVCSVCAAAGV